MNKQQTPGIYIELDCLLDTRLGTLARIGQQHAERVLLGNYHGRTSDDFDGVDMVLYRGMYANRDRETLKHSAPTEAVLLVRELVALIRKQLFESNSPYNGNLAVTVNTYPYKLTNEELDKMSRALAVRLADATPVELVYLPPQELTPAFVKQHFGVLVMYEYDPWMSLHFSVDPSKSNWKDVLTTVLQEVSLFAPAIFHKTPPSEDEIRKAISESVHPLKAIELLSSPIVGLQLLDVAYFSVIRPTRGHNAPQPT